MLRYFSATLTLSLLTVSCSCRIRPICPGDRDSLPRMRLVSLNTLSTCNRSYRVTHLLGKNLPLTWFRQFRQLMGRYCSCLLPRQDGGISQIQVNVLPSRCITLYIIQVFSCSFARAHYTCPFMEVSLTSSWILALEGKPPM